MAKYNWLEITREDVVEAIHSFFAYNPEYPEPKSTFLLYNGKKLPAKHIRGMAYEKHYKSKIPKSDFGGGQETVNFFERLGFQVEYSGLSELAKHDEIHSVGVSGTNTNSYADDCVLSDLKQGQCLRICMYLQTDERKNKAAYSADMEIVKQSNVDLIIFPEFCYVPDMYKIENADIANPRDIDRIYDFCLEVSRELGRAVVISTCDCYDTIYCVYANAFAADEETQATLYIKHTQTGFSALEFDNYPELAQNSLFRTILYKGYRLGMTICYDCNHALFSRMYALGGGVDVIVNCTGGDVVYDKWYKYNKARAIENFCCTLVTMGGDGTVESPKSYVYGFNPNGGELQPVNLSGPSDIRNIPGGLYVYEIDGEPGESKTDNSNIQETVNKKWQFAFEIGGTDSLLERSDKISEGLYRLEQGSDNIIFCVVKGMDILQPEKVLPLLYSEKLSGIPNKRYIILNRHTNLDEELFVTKLSLILKVRAMENFCAVILESDTIHKCYQTGKNRTAQVVKAQSGLFCIDLERTTGPEAIWKNKQGMRESWRKNFEWLIRQAASRA